MPAAEVELDFRTIGPRLPPLFSDTPSSVIHNGTTKFREDQVMGLSASQASHLMRSGHMTVAYYVSRVLSYIRERDSLVRAWVFLNEEAAMIQAETLDNLPPGKRGPLHGVAVGIKDIIAVKRKFRTLIHIRKLE